MSKQPAEKSEVRLSIRANASQKTLLARAASASHMNVSQFVLGASLREAENIIDADTRIVVSPDDYEWLVKLMDEAAPAPRLREAFRQKTVWDV